MSADPKDKMFNYGWVLYDDRTVQAIKNICSWRGDSYFTPEVKLAVLRRFFPGLKHEDRWLKALRALEVSGGRWVLRELARLSRMETYRIARKDPYLISGQEALPF